jgi:hypothetical protein
MEEYRYFAVLDCDNLVINACTFPIVTEESPESILNTYSDRYSLLEYSLTPGITNNSATIGHIYSGPLNAFIPKCPGEGYILDRVNYFWYNPNPTEADIPVYDDSVHQIEQI